MFQIWVNVKNGSTGQLSFLTLFLTFGGSVARIFTTLQETPDDLIMFYSFLVAGSLNGILVSQFIWYGSNEPAKSVKSAKAKKNM